MDGRNHARSLSRPGSGLLVVAELVYDARAGQDGLVLPWKGKVFVNPPYSVPAPWALRPRP